MLPIVKQRAWWYGFSTTLVIVSIIAFAAWGLKLGIDFTGGSLLELSFSANRPTGQAVITALTPLDLGNIIAQPIGDSGLMLKFKSIDEKTHQAILETIRTQFTATDQNNGTTTSIDERRFASIGPSIGQELKQKTTWAIGLTLIAIVAYISWAFRKVSKPVPAWKYGFFTDIALFHDVIITVGVFVFLGKFYGIEINAPFIAAILTILGYSVNDTIVVLDRIRENLIRRVGEDFETIVQDSVNQTLTRSINTSLTVLLSLFAILLFGGESIRDFALALIVGISAGTYSSIFLASPMLVTSEKFRRR